MGRGPGTANFDCGAQRAQRRHGAPDCGPTAGLSCNENHNVTYTRANHGAPKGAPPPPPPPPPSLPLVLSASISAQTLPHLKGRCFLFMSQSALSFPARKGPDHGTAGKPAPGAKGVEATGGVKAVVAAPDRAPSPEVVLVESVPAPTSLWAFVGFTPAGGAPLSPALAAATAFVKVRCLHVCTGPRGGRGGGAHAEAVWGPGWPPGFPPGWKGYWCHLCGSHVSVAAAARPPRPARPLQHLQAFLPSVSGWLCHCATWQPCPRLAFAPWFPWKGWWECWSGSPCLSGFWWRGSADSPLLQRMPS